MEEMNNNVAEINNNLAAAVKNNDYRKGFGAGVVVAMGALGLFVAIRNAVKTYKDVKESSAKVMDTIDDAIDDAFGDILGQSVEE